MQIKSLGEDRFIEALSKKFPITSSCVGIGDDAAVIAFDEDTSYLVTTDALVEGVHFIKEQIPSRSLGYKSVAVNVSDIAAMGGVPKYLFLTLAIPKETDTLWLEGLIEGIKEAADQWDIQLLGGDTVGSKRDFFINATLIGSAKNIKFRNGAAQDDILFVTGFLGDSWGGLKALQEDFNSSTAVDKLIQAHFRPSPSPAIGQWLASYPEVHSLMDISDGLDIDLRRMMTKSSLKAIVNLEALPLSKELLTVATAYQFDPKISALEGGEDYCLLGTIAKEAFDRINAQFLEHFGFNLFQIGSVTEGVGVLYRLNGNEFSHETKNFDHFE